MRETFLVIKAFPADMGGRPLNGPFASPDLSVGPDGRPRVLVWNLGTREVRGLLTEFASIPTGIPIHPENRQIIGYGNPANIPANSSVVISCTSIWPRLSTADVLMATVSHPELDPVQVPYDPLSDRHVAQMNYPWAGCFEGMVGGASGLSVSVQVRQANQGLFRVKAFVTINGRPPIYPQIDRTMGPTGHKFRWQQVYPSRKEDWELTMVDNQRLSVRYKTWTPDRPGQPVEEMTGMIVRC